MSAERFAMGQEPLVFDLTIIHKSFGWLIFLFSILGVLTEPSFFYLFFGTIGFWSVRRKRQILWRPDKLCWCYRVRNFFSWKEYYYDMSDKDTLVLDLDTYNHLGSSRTIFLSFHPHEEIKGLKLFAKSEFYLKAFRSFNPLPNILNSINHIKRYYKDIGKEINIDLSRLEIEQDLLRYKGVDVSLLKKELGID